MGSETQRVFLTDLAADVKNAIVGGPFGSNLVSKDYVELGVPVIRGQNMGGGKYVSGDFVYVSEEKAQKLKANLASPGDIVFTQRGTLGQVAIVPNSPWDKYVVSQSQMKATIDPEKADVEFLYYYFSSKNAIDYILANAIQTGVPHTNLTQLKEHPVDLPSIGVQKAIVGILRTLDNKIALNRQINTTLESMAQALFKSWFVDFDPVIDNALAAGNEIPDALQKRAAARAARREALRQQTNKTANETSNKTTGATDAASSEQALPETGLSDQRLPPEIQQLFPDRFVFTEEMGWVPEGWEVKPLSSIIELIGGGTPKTSIEEYWGGDIPWFSVVDAPNSSDVFVLNTEKSITQSGLDNSSAKLLRKGTTIISARGTVGKCAVVSRPMAMNQSCYGLVGANGNADFFTYYMVLRKVHELQQRSHGSVFSTITRDTFKGLNVADCSALLTQKFDEQIEYYMDRILCNLEQIQVLTNLRDSLLPKLLSGQLTIPDAEQQLAEVL